MTERPNEQPIRLRIRQQNMRTAKDAHLDLFTSDIHKKADIMLLQEPYFDTYGNTKVSYHWHVLRPTSYKDSEDGIMAVILVNKNISTGQWTQIDIPNTQDLVGLQLTGEYGKVSILNIYNSQHHDATLYISDLALRDLLNDPATQDTDGENYLIWAGDFNRHHPMWDDERNVQLLTNKNIDDAQLVIDIASDHGLEMALPQGKPTYYVTRNGNWTRPDNVFCTVNALEAMVRFTTVPEEWPTALDHLPIDIHLEIPIVINKPAESQNFRIADWDEYRDHLSQETTRIPDPAPIDTQEDFTTAVDNVIGAIQNAVKTTIKVSKPSRYSKRWWSKELDDMRKHKNKLSSKAYRHKDDPGHNAHVELREYRNKYNSAIDDAKQTHWKNFLEEADEHTLWTAGRYVKNPNGEGAASPRIPTLRSRNDDGTDRISKSNADKAEVIAKAFFPPPPADHGVPEDYDYPPPLPFHAGFTREHIRRKVAAIPPHKASGPDQIPNVVYKESIDILIEHLFHIFNAALLKGFFHDSWLTQIICVIRKPDRDNYDVPKSYRPIALLNTLFKILSGLLADITTAFAEQYGLLPEHHFGGRHGRRTTDSMHLLVHRIKQAWRRKKVVSILFLDIEGAFPNAVKERLVHNMRKSRVPTVIVNLVDRILTGRSAQL